MSPDKQNPSASAPGAGDEPVFVGEEDTGARSSPDKDLLAAIVIGLFALAAMYFALGLQVPDNALTAPGLLPFLTAITLFAMAVGLGVKALRTGDAVAKFRAELKSRRDFIRQPEARRTIVLMATVVLYVVAVDLVAFEVSWSTPAFFVAFSSYELISGIFLTFLLKFFWGAPIGRCLLVAFAWTIVLATIFRYGFNILLPGLA